MPHESIPPNRFVGQQFPGTRFDSSHEDPNTPQLSVNQITTFRWSLKESLENYRKAGVTQIGIWRQRFAECEEDEFAAIKAVAESGLKVSSVSFGGGFTGSYGMRYEEAIEDSIEAIRLAAILGAKSVLVSGGTRGGHIKSNALRLIVDGLNRIGDFAADNGVKIALHPMCGFGFDSFAVLPGFDDAVDVIDRCKHPSIGLAFSSFHHSREKDILQRISDMSHLINTVQLSDCRRTQDGEFERCPLGQGTLPLQQMVRSLVSNGYRGTFELDIWNREVWAGDYSELLGKQLKAFDVLMASSPVC